MMAGCVPAIECAAWNEPGLTTSTGGGLFRLRPEAHEGNKKTGIEPPLPAARFSRLGERRGPTPPRTQHRKTTRAAREELTTTGSRALPHLR